MKRFLLVISALALTSPLAFSLTKAELQRDAIMMLLQSRSEEEIEMMMDFSSRFEKTNKKLSNDFLSALCACPDERLAISVFRNSVNAMCDRNENRVLSIMNGFIESEAARKQKQLEAASKVATTKVSLETLSTNLPVVLDLDCGVEIKLMPVPQGNFLMGSPQGEPKRSDWENQVQVTISQPFYLAQTETTIAQYAAVIGKGAFSGNPSMPVTGVSWEDAMMFCEKLTTWAHAKGLIAGWKFILPTEAQWEYACRAGTTSAWHTDYMLLNQSMWAQAPSTSFSPAANPNRPFFGEENANPVAKKKPNAWGFYDMHGNAAEWCLDSVNLDAPNLLGGTNPVRNDHSPMGVVRGGDYTKDIYDCRSAVRRFCPKDSGDRRYGVLGFRVALVKE